MGVDPLEVRRPPKGDSRFVGERPPCSLQNFSTRATAWPSLWGQIRTWLDHERVQPSAFRLMPGGTVFRVEFNAMREAEAFARAFPGEVIRDERVAVKAVIRAEITAAQQIAAADRHLEPDRGGRSMSSG
jgi:hypothetical protein